uniref:Putative kinetochore protein ndc-80 n=1 Tax=Anthurium amnicola TaxID=1678845 RepID=A0A1D1ZF55_9ARAE
MGSSHFGELGLGNGRSGSSRRGKKSANDKPKQPQRGLGIAQLEKIRLHNQITSGFQPSLHAPLQGAVSKEDARPEMAFSSSPSSFPATSSSMYGFHPNMMMGYGDMERRDVGHSGSQSSDTARTLTSNTNAMWEAHHLTQPTVTLPLLRQPMDEVWMQTKRRKDRCDSMGSSSQNSDSSDTQELDLELKLSL